MEHMTQIQDIEQDLTRSERFEDLLIRLNWQSPTFLAKKWKISRKTVYNWKKNPPQVALDYLEQTVRILNV